MGFKISQISNGVKFQKNVLLKNYTSFKIGGKAKYFFAAKTKTELISAIKLAKEKKFPFFILGGGSNVLIVDKGFNGLVIKIQNTKYKTQDAKIATEAGATLVELVGVSTEAGLVGLEWAAGIPGTIGGALRGNASAFGGEIKKIIKEVEIFDVKDEKIKIFKNRDCKFKYKDSIFKQNPNLIILSAIIQLEKGNKKALQKKIKECLDCREKNQPLNFPSAGCIFKNYIQSVKSGLWSERELLKKYPEIKEFNKKGVIPAGWLVENTGLKGKRIGNVKVSEKHCNFIINLGRGKAKDVMVLIDLIKQKVKDKFKIILEEEIELSP